MEKPIIANRGIANMSAHFQNVSHGPTSNENAEKFVQLAAIVKWFMFSASSKNHIKIGRVSAIDVIAATGRMHLNWLG